MSRFVPPAASGSTRSTRSPAGRFAPVIRAWTAAGSIDAFTQRTEYDGLNRPVKQYQPYDPADSRYNDPNVYTETTYDKVGRVAKQGHCVIEICMGSSREADGS
nr:hypothetical protein OG999_20710 [Streptomyces sp. NBC_00886]